MLKSKTAVIFTVVLAIILVVSLCASCSTKTTTATQTSTVTNTATKTATATTIIKTIPLRFVGPWGIDSVPATGTQKFLDAFNARVNGQYEIKLYPGETLAKVPEFLEATGKGTIDMFGMALGAYSGTEPLFVEVPMIYNNAAANGAAVPDMMALYDTVLPKYNLKALAGFTTAGNSVAESKKAIRVMADWKGLLVGSISPGIAQIIKAMGASPVDANWTDTYSNLQKGVVDAHFCGLEFSVNEKIWDVAKYYTYFYATPSFNAFIINLDVFNKMPKDVQTALLEEAKKGADALNSEFVNDETKYMDTLTSNGMEVIKITGDERAKWVAACQSIIDSTVAPLGANGQKILDIAKAANATVK
jgi:TRAP-type transport system periplasmic protein